MARHSDDVHADRKHQSGSTDDCNLNHVLAHLGHEIDHVARKGRDGNVDQEPDRHMVGLEVDANHRSDFEKDKQKQQVLDAGMTF